MTDDLALLEAQQTIHELIAQQAPLETTLDAIAHWVGIQLPGAIVAFMRFDPARCTLSLTSSSRFSRLYFERLQNVSVGEGMASFGEAAYRRRQVLTEDILTDPIWDRFRDAALAEGLRSCWSSPVLSSDGELLGTFGTYYRDPIAPSGISRRRLQQAAALIALAIIKDRNSRQHRSLVERYHALFVNHPDGVYELDLEGRFLQGNAALESISGYSMKELMGRHFSSFVARDHLDQAHAAFDAAKRGKSRHYETQALHADGRHRYIDVINFPVVVEDEVIGVYGICRDITEQKQQEAKIAYQASHDMLTGLPNQLALGEQLERDYRWCQQHQRLLAVMYLDLDGFKAINEGLGYEVGNHLLVAIADRLRPLLGPRDTLARMTGDEFVFLLPDLESREEVAVAAERILAIFERSFEIEERVLHISSSIGVACSDEDTLQAHELLQKADLAVGVAERQGRNTWQWYQGGGKQYTNQHVLLRHDLHIALRDNQLELYYQPIIDAVTGRIRSLEALVRWHHPEHGMISPGVFIPIAEQSGQIIPLGRWVLRQVCEHLAAMRAKGERVFPVAVNISSLQFHRDGFITEVQAILDETGLPPELLELEMTESILLSDAEQAIERINTLRGMGITIAIDDFGTGFSSLGYLRDLPIQKIKLDRSFIGDILTCRDNAALVQGIITMAHHMDLIVVAEGVEEREQQEILISWKSDMLQGYLFAKPMPWRELRTLPGLLPAP
ncbi:EAL domain-containing protein [uncultured Halomonas sp.]|uniref:putative bifunctional diguanylate cyclase/phosphodiesterase n=1 Tax=uncultured Halomonas sp. TaxID=173971 RepID=UPI0026298FFB|nr:EAL domain-containing protein [uncultured Halomonas sp.]